MKIFKILPFLLILSDFFSQISSYERNGANSQDSRSLEESQMASLSKVVIHSVKGNSFKGPIVICAPSFEQAPLPLIIHDTPLLYELEFLV